jgi:hypothetical protein
LQSQSPPLCFFQFFFSPPLSLQKAPAERSSLQQDDFTQSWPGTMVTFRNYVKWSLNGASW